MIQRNNCGKIEDDDECDVLDSSSAQLSIAREDGKERGPFHPLIQLIGRDA